jgi:hypothetical protein
MRLASCRRLGLGVKRATLDWERARGGSAGLSHGVWIAHIKKYHNHHKHHTTTMKAPSTALLRTFSPLWRSEAPLATMRGCMAQQQQQRADFSSTPANQARDKKNKKDPRISMRARDRRGHIMDSSQQANMCPSPNQIPLATSSHTSTSTLLSVRRYPILSSTLNTTN